MSRVEKSKGFSGPISDLSRRHFFSLVHSQGSDSMPFSLRRNRLNHHLAPNRTTARPRYRPEIELLESRRLLSLSVGTNVNMSNGLHSGQAEASIAMNPTNPNNLVAFSNTDES